MASSGELRDSADHPGVHEFRRLAAITTELGAEEGLLFGKPCLKLHGKAFAVLDHDNVAVKLGVMSRTRALGVNGASNWDPSGKGRPMKDWIAIPASPKSQIQTYGMAALEEMRLMLDI